MPTIHYVEYDAAHPANFVYSIPKGLDAWLLVLTQTPAVFEVDGELKEFPAHSVALYPPGHNIYYRACSKDMSTTGSVSMRMNRISLKASCRWAARSPCPTRILPSAVPAADAGELVPERLPGTVH